MWRLRAPVLALLLVAACGGGDDNDETAAADTAAVAETAEAAATLLSPVRAASIALVELAQDAAQRANLPEVRQYAQTVGMDHRGVVLALDSVAQQRGLALTPTPAAQELENTVRTAHAGLDVLGAGDHDLAFIRAQVESHRQMLDRLELELIPGATSPELQQLLSDTRAMEAAHLTRARQLLANILEGGAGGPAGDTAGD